MDPLPGALEAFSILVEHFDVFILSTAPWDNPSAWTDKALWVKRHLGEPARKRLILTHRKDLNRGDFLVDDREKHGAKNFAGKHIHFKTEQFPDWASVLSFLSGEGVMGDTKPGTFTLSVTNSSPTSTPAYPVR